MQLPIDIDRVKGFLDPVEGQALYQQALAMAQQGPCLEVGSYCGKSTVYLGHACQQHEQLLYAVDHHRGSEEHQLGEEYHDPDLFDGQAQRMDSFREFRATMAAAKLEQTVVPVVASSEQAARHWNTPLSMVFIDGGHSFEAAEMDYRCWAPNVQRGGVLAIHDLFPNLDEGGQAPISIYRLALASGLYEEIEVVKTLGLLRRI